MHEERARFHESFLRVDKLSAKMDDLLNYTLLLKNQGPCPAENLCISIIFDKFQLDFLEDSLHCNEIIQYVNVSDHELRIDQLESGQQLQIHFQMAIKKQYQPDEVSVQANFSYKDINGRKLIQFACTPTTIRKNTKNTALPQEEFFDHDELFFCDTTDFLPNPCQTCSHFYEKEVEDICDYCMFQKNSCCIKKPGSVETPRLSLTKEVSKSHVCVGEIVTCIINVCNPSPYFLSNVIIRDPMAPSLKFIKDSVKIENVPVNGNIISGICLSSLNPMSEICISYDVEVIKKAWIQTFAKASYDLYQGEDCFEKFTAKSNECVIRSSQLELGIELSADKDFALIGDVIRCKTVICNKTDSVVTQLNFSIHSSACVKLLENSFFVNQQLHNSMEIGERICIDQLNPKEVLHISYDLLLEENTNLKELIIENALQYWYHLDEGMCMENCQQASLNILLGMNNFKQLNVESYLSLPAQKPDIEEFNSAKATLRIDHMHVIQTNCGQSLEGQKLSGFKLIFKASIHLVVVYSACLCNQPVHSAHCIIPFADFIVLPKHFRPQDKIYLETTVEDVYVKMLSNRDFFVNIATLIEALIS